MKYNKQVFDGIPIFVEVVKQKSFGLAAAALGHSPSHVSKEINKLETRLAVRLLQRTTRKVNLTPEGEAYYQQCVQLIENAIDAENFINNKQEEPQGTLKFSCPVSFGLSRIKPILDRFMAKYSKIDLEIDLSDHRVDIINDGYDVVVRAVDKLEDSSLIARKLMTSTSVTLASPSYIKKHGMPTHPNDLVAHKTISYRNLKQPNKWQYKNEHNENIEVNVQSKVITNSPEMALSLCLAGQGIIRTPLFNLDTEIADQKLVPLLAPFDSINITVYLLYPSRKHLSTKVTCFIDFLLAEVNKQ